MPALLLVLAALLLLAAPASAAPARAGDLTPLACVGPAFQDGRCAVEEPSLAAAEEVEVIGDRDVYVTDGQRLVLFHRDPATEALTFRACWMLGWFADERGCARFHTGTEPIGMA